MENNIWKDTIVRLLFLNIVLIILGYAFAGLTGMMSNVIMTPLKTFILLFSIFKTGEQLSRNDLSSVKKDVQFLAIFIGLIIIFLFFSLDFMQTVSRTSQFIVPFIYVFMVTTYLFLRYSKQETWYTFLLILNITYGIPVIYYMVFGEGFNSKNIYGAEEGSAFVSNHYGWASLLYILTFYDLIKNYNLSYWYKWIGSLMIIPSLYLLLISGNRSSYICFIIAGLIFLFRHNTINWFIRILFLSVTSLYIIGQMNEEGTALNERIKKTESQLDVDEESDTRKTARETGIQVMDKHPETYIIGFGLFSFKEAIVALEPSTSFSRIRSGVHNSYLELFFGSGIIVFLIFMICYIITPLRNYMRNYTDKFLFVLPVFIIPFFESNLTGGQFLFHPWLVTAMLLRYYR